MLYGVYFMLLLKTEILSPMFKAITTHARTHTSLSKLAIQSMHYLKNLFYYFESQNLLDPVNAVISFIEQWNHQPLRTEKNKSPFQI